MNRHNRPIFSAWDVRHAQGVPDDYVSVFNRAIGACPLRQSLSAEVEIDVLVGGEHLLRVVFKNRHGGYQLFFSKWIKWMA